MKDDVLQMKDGAAEQMVNGLDGILYSAFLVC